jgi:hypothetical protein
MTPSEQNPCERRKPGGRPMGIQHAPKSQRNAWKKRRKARKHKLRSTKKYKIR